MKPIIYPYKMGSRSAKMLADALNTRRVFPDRNYRPYSNHLIVNWGNTAVPNWAPWYWEGMTQRVLNFPHAVEAACNKLQSFQIMKAAGVVTPEFTENNHEAYEWSLNGHDVVVRTMLRANSGRGIHLVSPEIRDELLGSLANAPVFTKYFKKKHEYRVHVFKGEVIDVQQKKVRSDSEDNDWQIRNHQNGWVFCRENVSCDSSVLAASVAAVSALGLDFGAVDVGWNEHYQQAAVFEVNTAPGLEGNTLTNYVNAIEGLL